jgi:hypothetical protein
LQYVSDPLVDDHRLLVLCCWWFQILLLMIIDWFFTGYDLDPQIPMFRSPCTKEFWNCGDVSKSK